MSKSTTFAWSLVGILTLIVSLVSSLFLFSLGLILIEFLLYPLALGVVALLTAATAVMLSNRLAADGQHSPAKPVVLVNEGVAVILTILLIVVNLTGALDGPVIFIVIPAAVILTITAFMAARRYRSIQSPASGERRQILIWIGLALLAIPLVIFVASLFGWAGA
jgi:hypothetical protein